MSNSASDKHHPAQVEQLLKIKDIMENLGCARSKVYALIADGTLPPPVYISPNMPRFRASDYNAAIEKLHFS